MLSKTISLGIHGIDAHLVIAEVDIIRGLPGFTIVGLPDSTVKESKDRIRSAIENCGYDFPPKNYVVNLAPAGFKKQGSNFDLPIAIAILQLTGQVELDLSSIPMVGELSLDGSIRSVPSLISMVLTLYKKGYKKFIVPYENRFEASSIEGIDIFAAQDIHHVITILSGKERPFTDLPDKPKPIEAINFKSIAGQESVKRAAEVATAGFHNFLMYGPPGSGKSMIAKAIRGILPNLHKPQAIETTIIHSNAGILPINSGLISVPPFRAPHHTSSNVAIVGGGRIAMPGEVSLSHNGILFLDELTEFPHNVLQTLRQPLEDGIITISRAAATSVYPARFMLIAACNPCRCGFLFDRDIECSCSSGMIKSYYSKISGPLIDRVDIEHYVPRVKYKKLTNVASCEDSISIQSRIIACQDIQQRRYKDHAFTYNSQMQSDDIRKFCTLTPEDEHFLINASRKIKLSARSYFRILKVARTIADLEEKDSISRCDLMEALSYKNLPGNYERHQ